MELFMNSLLLWTVTWLHALAFFPREVTIDESDCDKKTFYLKEYEKTKFSANISEWIGFPWLPECHITVKFDNFFSYYRKSRYGRKSRKIKLEVALVSPCTHEIDIYTGNPRRNKAIATLNCYDNKEWIGHWPTWEVILKYRFLATGYQELMSRETTSNHHGNTTNYDMITTVRSSMCRWCYEMKRYHGYYTNMMNTLKDHQNKEFCLDNSFKVFKTIIKHTGFCGEVTFRIKERVPVCFISYGMYMVTAKSTNCENTVHIDGRQVLELNFNIWKEWCIPWELTKGQVLKFKMGKRSASGFCNCNFRVNTNTTNGKSSCLNAPASPTTTVRDYIHLSADDKEDTGSFTGDIDTAGILVGVVCLIVFICGGVCSVVCKKRNGDDRSIGEERSGTRDLYTMQSAEDRDTTDSTMEGRSVTANSNLPYTQQRRGQTIHNRRPFFDETEGRTHSEGPSSSYPVPLDGYIRSGSPLNRTLDSDQSTPLPHGNLRDTENPIDPLAPPPSYEDACRYDMFIK